MPRTRVLLKPVFTRWFGLWPLVAGRRALAPELRFRRTSITARAIQAGVGVLPFADASFDFGVVVNVLEQLPEPVTALAELRRVLRIGSPSRLSDCTANSTYASAGIAGKESNP